MVFELNEFLRRLSDLLSKSRNCESESSDERCSAFTSEHPTHGYEIETDAYLLVNDLLIRLFCVRFRHDGDTVKLEGKAAGGRVGKRATMNEFQAQLRLAVLYGILGV